MSNILIVAAHPDDETLGCGGTIAKYSAGHNFHCLFIADGVTSREWRSDYMYEDERRPVTEEAAKISIACKEACRLLGVKDNHFLWYPDARLDRVPLLQIIKEIEEYVEEMEKSGIYFAYVLTHFPGDLNIDHQIVSRAVQTAFRPLPGPAPKGLGFFEIPGSLTWSSNPFKPNVYVDITETLEKKIDAFSLYKSESRQPPHPRSPGGLRNLAKRRGNEVGYMAAEAFMIAYWRG